LRAITVNNAAMIAAIEKNQKKTVSQPDKIICRLCFNLCPSSNHFPFINFHLSFFIGNSPVRLWSEGRIRLNGK
jgi:hypothetical protein